MSLDDTSDLNLKNLNDIGDKWYYENKELIKQFLL